MTKHRFLLALAGGLLVLTACGSDDDGNGSGDGSGDATATGAQAEAAERTIEQAAEGGVELDRDCVHNVAAKLSDEDAEAIASGNDSDVSAEGGELALELIACADEDALADMFIEGMSQGGQNFDEDCVRDKLSEFDMTEIVASTQDGAPPAELMTAMMECFES